MSLILKQLKTKDCVLIKNGILNVIAYYSRRSNSKDADSPYKVVKSKIRLDDDLDVGDAEGGANWELFAPRGNRFYLPGLLGPAWQGSSTTYATNIDLEKFIDFQSKDNDKLHISCKLCPVLIRNNLHELFPAPAVFSKGSLTMITLSTTLQMEMENSAKNFVLAAREMCSRLRHNGYWADFMNPFSGRPFYLYSNGRNLYKVDERFRGINVNVENQNECLIISSDRNLRGFSGSIFTNAPTDLVNLEEILND